MPKKNSLLTIDVFTYREGLSLIVSFFIPTQQRVRAAKHYDVLVVPILFVTHFFISSENLKILMF